MEGRGKYGLIILKFNELHFNIWIRPVRAPGLNPYHFEKIIKTIRPQPWYGICITTIMKLLLLTILSAVLPFSGNWTADASGSKVSFEVKGPFGQVHGTFSGLKADIRFDEKDLGACSISASVEAKTVSTGVGLRNHDLRSKSEWFDADKYPQIAFKSQKIEKTADGFKAVGDLTLKGVTKPAEIPFTFTSNGGSGTSNGGSGLFKGTFTLKREDFNLGKSGGSVGSVVTIHLEVPVKK